MTIAALVLASAAEWAFADDTATLQEITVTATRTGATPLQKTPMAISAFTAQDVAQLNLNDVHDLQQYTPSLRVSQNGPYAQIYVRGIGSNNVFNGADPSVTTQVDGVYIARPYAQFRVEEVRSLMARTSPLTDPAVPN